MKLTIDNIAKIGHAELLFDGLTVVIGDNNKAKSTIGRVLYTMFHSLYRPGPNVVRLMRKLFFSGPEISRLRRILNPDQLLAQGDSLTEDFCQRILSEIESNRKKERRLAGSEVYDGDSGNFRMPLVFERSSVPWSSEAELSSWSHLVYETARRVLAFSHEQIWGSLVADAFRENFSGQYEPLFRDRSAAPHVRMEFSSGAIDYAENGGLPFLKNNGVDIVHDARFIASPMLLNAVSSESPRDVLEPAHRSLLVELRRPDTTESLFKDMIADRMRPVQNVIDGHFIGKFVQNKTKGGLKVSFDNLTDPLKAANVSMGLKSFGLIKLMLERNILQDRDVLILDEPENHLHPAWQLAYAEAIVMLQRIFGLTILLTTHSPYFLEALQLYSRKHAEAGRKRCLHVYEPYEMDIMGRVGMNEITDDEEKLYGKFSRAFRELDLVRAQENDPADHPKGDES